MVNYYLQVTKRRNWFGRWCWYVSIEYRNGRQMLRACTEYNRFVGAVNVLHDLYMGGLRCDVHYELPDKIEVMELETFVDVNVTLLPKST